MQCFQVESSAVLQREQTKGIRRSPHQGQKTTWRPAGTGWWQDGHWSLATAVIAGAGGREAGAGVTGLAAGLGISAVRTGGGAGVGVAGGAFETGAAGEGVAAAVGGTAPSSATIRAAAIEVTWMVEAPS